MSELKQCPFCNAEMKYTMSSGGFYNFYKLDDSHELNCPLIGADLTSYTTLDQLVSEWNGRSHENKIKADAVRQAARFNKVAYTCLYDDLEDYANELERGEVL